ncbi:uncharacterized protein LOC103710660 isoform X1 [Phoenix dactylifera]|uniref:Uncharacterized protein LOC103710660 isoform X1 n=1 Tax=Phoenix dactylifera TaxID=42345 RepID=A0A8B9A8J3_PHODC|nr:uncharacterized protein LOC103710660 isoform X1 [Phoenix dactylifera]
MFTEGLDEKAINWIKQGSDADPQPRSPLIEKYPLDSVSNQPLLYKSNNFLSPKVLPPVKFHSGLLGPRPNLCDSEDDESVASIPEDSYVNYSDTFEEDGLASSDSDLFEKPKCQSYEDEINSGVVLSHELTRGSDSTLRRTLLPGLSKENLRVEVGRHVACTHGARGIADRSSISGDIAHNHWQDGLPSSHDYPFKDSTAQRFQGGTPSAPPIEGNGADESSIDAEDGTKLNIESTEVPSDLREKLQKVDEVPERSISGEGNVQMPSWQTNLAAQIPSYTTSVQSAWQTFIAYDACFRLCLNAWARNCMEAPEFLRDECMALRNAFGIQKYLLQPHGQILEEGRHVDNKEVTGTMKGRKVIGQIEVEVKKIRIIPQRKKLRATSSYRSIYMQVGTEYVRHVSTMLKSHINSLKATSFPVAPEEVLSCLLQLKSSSEDALTGPSSQVCLKPGTGDSHVFYPESQGDALLVEVQDINTVKQGHAIIQMSSLINSHQGEVTRWWPLYQDDHGCVGNVQLSICISGPSEKMSSTKGGPVVETTIYDLVLEAAMRAQHFHPKNLHINGAWRWLLNEFSDYYGVSEAYTKLRYLSYIMNIATPTKDCLELVYELLLPIIRARDEKILTRQERSILLDCEEQIKMLLATTFENYKSLDDLSPTGLTDMFDPILESAAPALIPAVQIFTLLHDILSHEAQNTLRNYLQTAAAKRCRRHMVETDEFMSGNSDGLYTDSVTISTAYLKMKILCINISHEIQADIKIHNQHILPSSIDLPNIAASLYSTELCKRLRGFLSACPPAKPSLHVTELLTAAADFERNLDSWNIRPVHGGVVSKDLFHNYIMVWIQETRLHLLELCKAEKVACSGISTICSTSPFVETMYDQIKESLLEYQVVINRWPQYLMSLESVVADIERAIMKTLEKQYNDVLMPLKDGIPKILEKQVQKLTRRHSTAVYLVPNQLGTFLCTMKRILDVLHCRVEDFLKSWALFLRPGDGNPVFGEQMNGITVMLRKKYKKYMQAIVEKLVSNAQATRNTRLKKILGETKEAEGEAEIRERMQALYLQITDSIRNLHDVFSSRIFVAICRGFWDRMGQIVLSFLESRKENKVWYRGSDYALGIIDDIFASEMQKLQGNSLQDKDLDPPRSVIEARSILC